MTGMGDYLVLRPRGVTGDSQSCRGKMKSENCI